MCGRYAFYSSKEKVIEQFKLSTIDDFTPNYNVGPGQPLLIIKASITNQHVETDYAMWGIKPEWSDAKSKLLINARCETVHQKSTFKKSFESKRCIIIANGWYEWLREDKQKTPFYFYAQDKKLLALAGLTFDVNGVSHVIIMTRKAPSSLTTIHHRCPLLLEESQILPWLSTRRFSYISDASIKVFDDSKLAFHQVSQQVNSLKNNSATLINSVF